MVPMPIVAMAGRSGVQPPETGSFSI